MATASRFYELSLAADVDLEEIFNYTEQEYGFGQAIEYLHDLEQVFENLTSNPELGKERNEIKRGLRSFPKVRHVIFYRVFPDRIRIVRVLHGSRDLPRFFELP